MSERTQKGLLGLILFGAFLLYSPLIFYGTITSYDDSMLLAPLKGISTLGEYLQAFNRGAILDLQPIRDLSFFIDLKLGLSFYLTNFLLLAFIGHKLYQLLRSLGHDSALWIVAVFIFSPIVMSSGGWIAARKHLLCVVFIVPALIEVFRWRDGAISPKASFKISFLYTLSVLSQPMNVFFPISAWWITRKNKSHSWSKLRVFLMGLCIFWVGINFYYYQTQYVVQTAGDGKFNQGVSLDLGLSLLALGRYVFSTLVPLDYVLTPLSSESWKNITGVFLAATLAIFIFKFKKRNLLDAAVLFFVPLLPVLIFPTRIFASQSYLLSSLLAAAILAAELFGENKKSLWILITLGLINLACSIHYVFNLGESDKISHFSNEKERTIMTTMGEVERLIRKGDHLGANREIEELKKFKVSNRYLPYLEAKNIYLNHGLSDEQKLLKLEAKNLDSPYVDLALALMYSNRGEGEQFKKFALKIYQYPQRYVDHSYLKNEEVLALYRVGCEKNKCVKDCKNIFDEFEKKVELKEWNKELYKQYYYQFKNEQDNLGYK